MSATQGEGKGYCAGFTTGASCVIGLTDPPPVSSPERSLSSLRRQGAEIAPSGLRYPVRVSGNLHGRGCAGVGGVRAVFRAAVAGVWVAGTDYQEEMSGGVRVDGVDEAAVRVGCGVVPESFDTHNPIPLHGRRALRAPTNHQRLNRSQWPPGRNRRVRRHHHLHLQVPSPTYSPQLTPPALGGFRISFITDNIQGAMVIGLIVIGCVTVGTTTHIDRSLVSSSDLLGPSLLGWQLIYILPVAILTNDFFISGFWMRTFASKSDKDLVVGTSVATVAVAVILTLVGASGLLAAWTGAWPGDPAQSGSIAFFLLLEQLPAWVVGIVLVMTVSLSTAAFDSLQSAMVSTGSNDIFRNRLDFRYVRLAVVLVIFPVVVVALKSPSVLQIYLISDLVSASSIPVLVVGLSDRCYWWRGFEVVVGGLGGLLTVFIFGAVYYGNAHEGAHLMLLENGLYADDWSAFGAFVAAPVGGLSWGFGAFALRIAFRWVRAKVRGERFDAFDRPVGPPPDESATGDEDGSDDVHEIVASHESPPVKGDRGNFW